jgi:membrane peptidoglycan carboxypeptidase
LSNPDSPGPYWQESAGPGRRGARSGRGGEGPYDRARGSGRPAADGNGRSSGSGQRAGNGRPAGTGNGAGRYGRPDGNGTAPSQYDRPAGTGSGADRYGRPPGNGWGSSRPDRGSARDMGGSDDPRGARHGRRRAGGAVKRDGEAGGGSGVGSELRARLGLGKGSRDAADARDLNAPVARNARPGGWSDDGARSSGWDSRSVPGSRNNGGRPAPAADGRGQGGPGGRPTRGPRADEELRARLGLRSEPGRGTGRGPGRSAAGAGGNGYGGAYGYGGSNGFSGDPGDVSDYRAPGGRRGATALRERGTAGFTDTRTRGPRRASGYADGSGPGDGGGGQRTRRKGSWWRHWTWRKAIAVAAGAGAVMMLLIVAAVVYLYAKTQIPTEVSEAALQQSSTVYFSNGKTQVGTFTADGIDRQMLTSGQIPSVMKNAIIAAEDRHFYTEGGISVSGILRSAYEDLKGGGNLQGGSTLTEEFVKNYYTTIGSSRTVSTKLKEIFISIKLSHEESKDWILTQYLNTVPFGDNAYGVAAAAQIYFGEPAANLTVSQAAMLAAMVNEPGFFNPDPSAGAAYQALVARWQYVMTNMVRDGAISQAQANAQTFPKVTGGNALATGWTGYRGYIMQAVRTELKSTYGYSQTDMDSLGLKIVTTFSLQKMNALYRAVDQNLAQMKADGHALPTYAHVGALLEQPGTGAILAEYGGPSYSAPNCLKIKCEYDMAMESRNLVGSSFKPYVLATAVKEGMDVQNSVLNAIEPMCVPPDTMPMTFSTQTTNCPPGWFPVNINGEQMGPINVTQAAAQSSDPAFEDLIHRAGTQATINMAKAFGVNVGPASLGGSGLQNKVGQVGMALGTASLTVEEQATTFATLAADGEYATPHVIAQITQNGNNIALKITHRQVLNAAQAADVDYALSFDTIDGTAEAQGQLNPLRPVIGKTGTTDQAQSAFFIGAIPQYSLAVGMFTNSQNEQPGGESLNILPQLVGNQTGGYGGAWPTAIWRTYMQNEFSTLPILPLPTPDYVGFTKWDQVPTQHHKPKPQHNPNPNQNQNQCPPGQHHVFGVCIGGGNPNPNPTPTNPNPTPSPTPSPTPTRGPFGGGTEATAAVPLAEDPTTTVVRPPDSG